MNESRATRYQRYQRRARRAGVVSGGLMLATLALTPAGRALADKSEAITRDWPAPLASVSALILFVGTIVVLWEVALLLPMRSALTGPAGRTTERPPLGEALAAQAQATVVALPAAIIASACIDLSAGLSAEWWWIIAGLLIAAALVGAMHGMPSLLVRLSGARRVERPALVERLGTLARQVRVPIASIDELPPQASATTSALVVGAGASRRVFISSELMQDWTDEEIAVVVAHELAHHANHDLWRTLGLDAGVLSVGFWAADRLVLSWGPALGWPAPGDLAALPLVALVAASVWLVATPLRHAVSRRQERRADAFALQLTGSADAFRTAIRRLAVRHLAEERPSRLTRWLYHRHPTVAERLALADLFQEQDGITSSQ